MSDSFHGCMVAGTHSGVGKTTWALALMALARKKGLVVQPFKVGPDYIDPAFHDEVCMPRKSRNLDLFLLSRNYVKESFAKHSHGAGIAVIEGVMGLFDGKAVKGETGSSAEMAKVLGAPVFLVIDGSGMATSAAALVKGFRDFDPGLKLAGVFINRVNSEGHFQWLKRAIEENTGVPCLGYLPQEASLEIPERHLGLTTAAEMPDKMLKINKAAALLADRLDWDVFILACKMVRPAPPVETSFKASAGVRIGIAQDAAFSFYYADNLDLLEKAGAELVFFSPLSDAKLPENLDLIYFGGGFPEVYAPALSQNEAMKNSVRTFYAEGGSLYGECGGLIYLAEAFVAKDGSEYPLAGLVPGKIRMTPGLQNFGYKEFKTRVVTFLFPAGRVLRSHEFHYSAWDREGQAPPVYELNGRLEGYAAERLVASYQHLHFGGNPGMAEQLVSYLKARQQQVWTRN